MQTYQIRRNCYGEMLYFDAMELINLCLDHNILQGEKHKWIAMYHEKSETQPDIYPAGFYKDDYEMVIHSLMQNDSAIHLLLHELSKKSIVFQPSLDITLLHPDLLETRS